MVAAFALAMSELSDEELQELYAWIDDIPLSRQKKNITRDFSDGVLTAEVVNHFLPRLVELHNYSPANATQQKTDNWKTLNSTFMQLLMRHLNNLLSSLASHLLSSQGKVLCHRVSTMELTLVMYNMYFL